MSDVETLRKLLSKFQQMPITSKARPLLEKRILAVLQQMHRETRARIAAFRRKSKYPLHAAVAAISR